MNPGAWTRWLGSPMALGVVFGLICVVAISAIILMPPLGNSMRAWPADKGPAVL
jgi:hypothetical protein